MNIPNNNSLKEQIKVIVSICEELAEDYGDDASWFNPPATEEEISKWEEEKGIVIPDSYKEWLRFSNGSQLLSNSAKFSSLNGMVVNAEEKYLEDFVIIGHLCGDGELLCFSKSTLLFASFLNGKRWSEYEKFDDYLNHFIELRGLGDVL